MDQSHKRNKLKLLKPLGRMKIVFYNLSENRFTGIVAISSNWMRLISRFVSAVPFGSASPTQRRTLSKFAFGQRNGGVLVIFPLFPIMEMNVQNTAAASVGRPELAVAF